MILIASISYSHESINVILPDLLQILKKGGVDLVEIDRKIGTDASSVSEYLKNGDIDCVFRILFIEILAYSIHGSGILRISR